MTSGAPWSVKGIDPKAREIAKDLARRSGMTLGEWLNQMILDDGAAPAPSPEPARRAGASLQSLSAGLEFPSAQPPKRLISAVISWSACFRGWIGCLPA